MRIAQVAPLAEAVPPKLYGGTERVVSWLTEELTRQGHDVTLFASGDSTTSAELVGCAPKGLRLAGIRDHVASHLVMLNEVRTRADQFDIIHFHVDLLHMSSSGIWRTSASRPCMAGSICRTSCPSTRPFRDAPGLDLQQPARADAIECELACDGLSWHARDRVPFQPDRRASISPSSAASHQRSAPTVRSRSRSGPAFR